MYSLEEAHGYEKVTKRHFVIVYIMQIRKNKDKVESKKNVYDRKTEKKSRFYLVKKTLGKSSDLFFRLHLNGKTLIKFSSPLVVHNYEQLNYK